MWCACFCCLFLIQFKKQFGDIQPGEKIQKIETRTVRIFSFSHRWQDGCRPSSNRTHGHGGKSGFAPCVRNIASVLVCATSSCARMRLVGRRRVIIILDSCYKPRQVIFFFLFTSSSKVVRLSNRFSVFFELCSFVCKAFPTG